MTINLILTLMKDDSILKKLLNISSQDPKIYEFASESKDDCISYVYTNLTNDKIKCQDRLEVNCISADRDKALEIAERVKDLILTFGDEPLNHEVLSVIQNGGGSLRDLDLGVYKEKIIFDIVRRK